MTSKTATESEFYAAGEQVRLLGSRGIARPPLVGECWLRAVRAGRGRCRDSCGQDGNGEHVRNEQQAPCHASYVPWWLARRTAPTAHTLCGGL
jgi:hypothetical protein